jgi:uridine kinase
MKPVILVGICGGTASGKTTLCEKVAEELGVKCASLGMDSFYRGLSPEEHDLAAEYNFDHPNALDFDSIHQVVETLLNRQDAEIPIYDFVTHTRRPETQTLNSADLILFEGIHSFFDEQIRARMNLKIFVQTDDDLRLARRLQRDIE